MSWSTPVPLRACISIHSFFSIWCLVKAVIEEVRRLCFWCDGMWVVRFWFYGDAQPCWQMAGCITVHTNDSIRSWYARGIELSLGMCSYEYLSLWPVSQQVQYLHLTAHGCNQLNPSAFHSNYFFFSTFPPLFAITFSVWENRDFNIKILQFHSTSKFAWRLFFTWNSLAKIVSRSNGTELLRFYKIVPSSPWKECFNSTLSQ